ncbi:carbohydrate-binding module family 32 protein [Annulohypoxylon bovei var. microspora]|nr:carbohydrate-binding module family 32 protein [Annulohypoxylon bovei var. microspora]
MLAKAWAVSGRRWTLFFINVVSWLSTVAYSQAPPAAYLQTPSTNQLEWHRLEYYAFVHFGPNTFTNEEWGTSQSTPDVFAPTALDTDQWAKSFVDAGMAGMILTAKHHDGMALWDTNTTTYKIGNGKWAKDRVAQGLNADVVQMAAASAEKYGIKFGIYLSPWDIHRDPAMPKPNLTDTIYDEPQIFGDDTPGDYNELYAQQLTELVTTKLSDGSPIQVSELWLDGNSGSDTVQTFNWTDFRNIIREYQPGAIMWGHQGVDARWVGNEDGVTVATNWHTISRTQDETHYSGDELQTGVRDGIYWTPAEADARLRDGWFYHADEQSKTADTLMNMYLQSVGRSVNLLLDVPPDTTGQVVQGDVDILLQFKSQRDAFLNRPVLTPGLSVNASSVRDGNPMLYGPANVLDGNKDTYWAINDNETTSSLEVDLNGIYTVDAFITQEHIALGQRIGGYTIDAVVNGTYTTLVTGTSLGYKRIDGLSVPVETNRIRLRITQANATPLVNSFQVLGAPSGSP